MLCTHDRRLACHDGIAVGVNGARPLRLDGQTPRYFQPFNHCGEVAGARRFGIFAQPGQRRPAKSWPRNEQLCEIIPLVAR